MAYATVSELRTSNPDVADLDEGMLSQAIAAASAEIDGNIARFYTLPITVPVPLLTSLNVDIALYRVFTNRAFQGPPRPAESAWDARYKTAVAILLKLATGEMLLTDVNGVIVTQSSSAGEAWSNTMNYVPTFWEGADQGFIVDPDKIDAESMRRL